MSLPNAVVGHGFAVTDVQWSEIARRYAFGLFALFFFVVTASGIQLSAAYWSSRISLPSFSQDATIQIPAQPLRGPNMVVGVDQAASTLSRITGQPIIITVGDKTDQTITVKPETVKSWLQIVTDKKRQATYIHVSDSAVTASLNELAKPYVKPPLDQISVTHEDASNTVISAGQDGKSLGDLGEARLQIKESLLGAKGLQLNMPLETAPFQSVSATSIDKLLEVNVITKQMWAYDKGVLTRSYPISAGAPATPTPIGRFKIYQKLPIQDMRGYNADGTKYFQPNVRWVNYFLEGGYAIHGNYWRSQSWFGAINSSHGCVSLPDEQAKWIYDWAPIGTTVITHR